MELRVHHLGVHHCATLAISASITFVQREHAEMLCKCMVDVSQGIFYRKWCRLPTTIIVICGCEKLSSLKAALVVPSAYFMCMNEGMKLTLYLCKFLS